MHACLSKPADFTAIRNFIPGFLITPDVPLPSAYARALRNTEELYYNGARIGALANPEGWELGSGRAQNGHPEALKVCAIEHRAIYVHPESISMKNMPLLREALRSGLMVDRARTLFPLLHWKSPRHIVRVMEVH